jgi:hypothetical protein
LIGAPKTGSTALHVALARHPQIFMSPVKEPKFFLTDGPPPIKGGPGDARTFAQHVWRREDYEALFDPAPPGAMKGESTTLYLGDPAAHERIARNIPHARLIAVVRDPVDRAHSNWTHLFSAGLEPESDFLAACRLEPDRLARGWAPFWGYTNLGRYGEHLTHLFSRFDREQVLVLTYRELRNDPAATLDRVCAHLGVDSGVVTDIPPENVTAAVSPSRTNQILRRVLLTGSLFGERLSRFVPEVVRDRVSGPTVRLLQREQRPRSPLTPEQHAALMPTFDADIRVLERLLGRSFDHWRDPGNAVRNPLHLDGQFGTGYRSIDRPTADRH